MYASSTDILLDEAILVEPDRIDESPLGQGEPIDS